MTTRRATASNTAAKRWKLVAGMCRAAIAVLVAFGVWSIGFAPDDGPAPVLPETSEQFSLDLEVVATANLPVIYAVEQRARPAYRIFAFDPTTGTDTTVFTVPDNAIIYGIALSPDGTTLAVTYTPDYDLDGAGLWLLDLDSQEMTMVRDVESGVYHVDPTWTTDATAVLTTRVDRTSDSEQLGIGRISTSTGDASVVVPDVINPVVLGDVTYGLTVDADLARRSITRLDNTGTAQIASGDLDLDHLVAVDGERLAVAGIAAEETNGLTFGTAASAHGNHNTPSTWWQLATDDNKDAPTASNAPSAVVYDATSPGEYLVVATTEGLAIEDPTQGTRTQLITSRAIRLVAA